LFSLPTPWNVWTPAGLLGVAFEPPDGTATVFVDPGTVTVLLGPGTVTVRVGPGTVLVGPGTVWRTV
jgi:hypothetical protein